MIPAHFIVRRIGLAAGSYNETIVSGANRGVAAPILDRNASDLPTLRPSTLTPSELRAIEVATAKRLEHASLLRIVQVLRTEWDNAHPNKMFGNEDARDLWQAARKKMEEKAAATKLAAAEQARLASEAAAKQTTPYPTTMRAEEFLDAEARSERDLEEALNRALSRAAQDSWPSSEPTGPTDPPVLVVQFPVDPMAEDFGKYEAQFGSDVRGNPVPSVCTQPVPDGSFAVAWYARFCALLIAAILQSNGVAEGSARFVFAARYLGDTPAAVSFTFHDGTIDQFEMAASLLSAAGVACFTFLLHTRVPARHSYQRRASLHTSATSCAACEAGGDREVCCCQTWRGCRCARHVLRWTVGDGRVEPHARSFRPCTSCHAHRTEPAHPQPSRGRACAHPMGHELHAAAPSRYSVRVLVSL